MEKNIVLNIIKIIFLIQVFTCTSLLSQESHKIYNEIKKKYPGESYVQLSQKYNYKINLVDNKIETFIEDKSKYIYLKGTQGLPINRSVYSSLFKEVIDIEANTYILKNNKYKKIKVKEFKEKTNVATDSFYDDVKEIDISFPGVSEGAIIELNSKFKLHEPRLLSSFYLSERFPVNEFEIEIVCDKDINLDLVEMNLDSTMHHFTLKKGVNTNTYKVKYNDLKKYSYDRYSPDPRYFIPHIIPIIRSAKYEEGNINILKSPRSLYNWYYKFIENIDKNIDTTAIKLLADSITSGCTSEFEKVKQLYYWVQSNIKYIAFEYGFEGYIPRKADAILNNQYGDCKDNTSILFSLLKASGIESYFTWIGTNDIPYSYHKVPTPASDNHMILTYINNGVYYFLDGTGKYQNIDYPPSFIQGKEALISKQKNDFEIKKVPIITGEQNQIIDSVYMEIDSHKLLGNGNITLTGYDKLNFQHKLIGEKSKKQKEILESLLEKGNNKFILNEVNTGDLQTFDNELKMTYQFELNSYFRKLKSEIYLNLNLNKKILNYRIKKERESPMDLKNYRNHLYITRQKIPQGYYVHFLPENINYKNNDYSYSIEYSIDNNEVIYKHQIYITDLYIDKDEFEEWNSFISSLESNYKQTILLKSDETQTR